MASASPIIGFDEFAAYLNKIFKITLSDIKILIREFHTEMQKGLTGYESSLKMIPSYVDRPNGKEKGQYIALDLGGTNFRVLSVELDGRGNASVTAVSKFAIDIADMQGTAEQLFGFIANCIHQFIEENQLDKRIQYDLAFTFSFPVDQTNIAAGKLLVWTKGFTAKGVEGEDVIVLLNEALKKKDIHCIRVAALANDTVGTLVARSYKDPSCDLGVILGTGTNACYPEKLVNIQKWRGLDPKGHMIINMEWGNFNKLRLTNYDKDLDLASPNTGAQFLEKMVSGMYLGEITRLVVQDMIHRGLIFLGSKCTAFEKKGSLLTENMSLVAEDNSANLGEVEFFLKSKGITNITAHDKNILKHVCDLVSTRAAKISGGSIAAVLSWMDPELKNKHTVGIDGSLFEKYPGFARKIKATCKDVFGENALNIEIVHAKDGSGKGAAIIAAVAAQSEK